jgi:hypothetical protein
MTIRLNQIMFLPESPLELLLGSTGACHIDGQQELLEVDVAVFVRVEGSEHVVAKLLGVSAGEEHLVHVNKLDGGQTTVGTVLLESLVPLLDGVLVVSGVSLQELQIFLGQALLALDTTHGNNLFICLFVFV